MPSDNRRLAINARPPFTIDDAVPVGFSKSTATAEQFTLTVSNKEGLFADNSVGIFLHDKQLGQFYDLATPYELTLDTAILNDRYELVYQNQALSNPELSEVVTAAYVKSQQLHVATNAPMKNVLVYDLTGKLLRSISVANETQISTVFPFAEGVYLLKVQLDTNLWYTHKLITSR